MDMSKRDELYESKNQLHKNLKEAFGRMLGVSSVAPISSDSNSAVQNRNKLGSKQGVSYPSQAFKEAEDEGEELDLAAPEEGGDEMASEAGADLEVPADADASGIDDAAEDDGASEVKMNADAVAQAYLGQLPSDVPVEADDQGIVFTEFHDDQNGPFKVLLFPADMSIAEVGEVKEPAQAESPLDAEEGEEGMEDLGGEEGMEEPAPEGGELDLGAPEEGGEEEIAPEEELAEADMEKGAQDGPVDPKIEGEEESAKLNASPVMEEGVEMEKGAKDGIEDPDQTGTNDDNNTRATHQSPMCEEDEEECEDDEEKLEEEEGCEDEEKLEEKGNSYTEDEEVIEEVEQPVLRESARDRRLRKKGLIGNDRDPAAEEAEREAERDPMRAGRKSWQAMMESRRRK